MRYTSKKLKYIFFRYFGCYPIYLKMYYCEYYSCLVYGIMDKDKMIIDPDWLSQNFNGCSIYTSDVIRDLTGNAIYGVSVTLNTSDGTISISPKNKKCVEELYDLLLKYYKDCGEVDDLPTIGYYNAIHSIGASNAYLTSYIPENNGSDNNNNK